MRSGAASDRVKPPLGYLEAHSNKNIAPRRMFFLKKVVILNILINFAMKKPINHISKNYERVSC